MPTVLITGGAGFIGSHTADALLAKGYGVRILDNLQPPVHRNQRPEYVPAGAELIVGDVRNRDDWTTALEGVDAVFHLAAYQDYLPDFSTFCHTNIVSTALLFELIVERDLPIRKVIVASSQFVHGEGLYARPDGTIVGPPMRRLEQLSAADWEIREDGTALEWQWTPESYARPTNAYSLSKHAQENVALTLGERYDIPAVAMRYSIVQGARQSVFNAYSGACRIFSLSYLLGQAPTIYEDGLQRRDFVNVHDVIDANLLVLEDPSANGQAFCVGGGHAYTVTEFDRVVAREFGREDLKPNIRGEFRFGDTRNACSDTTKLRALGWRPRRTIEDSVREYRHYLEQRDDLSDILARANQQMKALGVVRQSQA